MRSLSLWQCFSLRYNECKGDNESVCLIRRSGDEVYLMGCSEWYVGSKWKERVWMWQEGWVGKKEEGGNGNDTQLLLWEGWATRKD
jgi:hypothetical protein